MEVISSIYNSGYNIKKFYLGSRELNLAYLGNQVIYDEVIGDNDLNYILYEFYGSDTLPNTVEAPVKSAILKGSTKYRDIDTGDILDTFDETKNLELVSVKMPVLTTIGSNLAKESYVINPFYSNLGMTHLSEIDDCISPGTTFYIKGYNIPTTINLMIVEYDGKNRLKNSWFSLAKDRTIKYTVANENCNLIKIIHDENCIVKYGEDVFYTVKMMVSLNENLPTTNHEPYKSNILTVNEDVTLRSNGDVYDELNLLTGRLTQRIDENNEVLAQAVVKTVDLTMVDQDGKTINKLNSFNGTTHVSTEVAENNAYPMVSLEVASELQAAMSKVAEDIELIKPVQNDIETTLDTQSNDIDSLLLATTELFEMFL